MTEDEETTEEEEKESEDDSWFTEIGSDEDKATIEDTAQYLYID